MAHLVLTQAAVWLAQYELTGALNAVAVDYGAELQDDTTFADGGFRSRMPGLRNCTAQVEGLYDTGSIDSALFSQVGATSVPFSVVPQGATEGNRAFTFYAQDAGYTPGGTVGDMLGFSASAQGDSDLIRGTLAHYNTRTSTGTGTAYQLGAASSSQRLYAALHVLTVSGSTPSLTVTIESDNAVGFPSAATALTLTAATAATSQFASVAGPITDDWFRVKWTISGSSPSFQFVVVFGVR
jgi:hypothetical protein